MGGQEYVPWVAGSGTSATMATGFPAAAGANDSSLDPAFANLVGDTVEMPMVASLPTLANGAFANPKWQPLLETALLRCHRLN